ncbi:hypothetical protein O4H49_02275 [Kiloniella laminariae]|uniref:ABM domain-containing protein n=1 Tax=Kiloniella laminariae TaxID=454162 RepID=A0ABT4LGW7_9PROT|nr:hypothetical protein [Kiloniella laminariae]MCZ4279586.1 hypothetical protein [Kiloniella laminariae]
MSRKHIASATVTHSLSNQAVLAEDSMILEIAWFKLLPGVEEARFVEGAQHVQDHFLRRFSGRIYRELLRSDDDDQWIDSIHWRSVGDFEKAAAEILTDPDGAAIMSLIDPSTIVWFHADRKRHWKTASIPQGSGYTEIQFFRLVAPGSEIEYLVPTTDEEFLAAAEAIQQQMANQPGFSDREIFRTTDGWWLDLIHWQSKEAAESAMAKVMTEVTNPESVVTSFVSKIDPKSRKSFKMNQGRVW